MSNEDGILGKIELVFSNNRCWYSMSNEVGILCQMKMAFSVKSSQYYLTNQVGILCQMKLVFSTFSGRFDEVLVEEERIFGAKAVHLRLLLLLQGELKHQLFILHVLQVDLPLGLAQLRLKINGMLSKFPIWEIARAKLRCTYLLYLAV